MSTINNLPWQRIKGPRTKRRRCNYNKLRKIPDHFTRDSLVKLKCNFDVPGVINVWDHTTGAAKKVQSVYRPLIVKNTGIYQPPFPSPRPIVTGKHRSYT